MQQKITKITKWLQEVYKDKPAVVAVSGGVDSAVVLTLLVKALGAEKVYPVLLPYHDQDMEDAKLVADWNGVQSRTKVINIGSMVDAVVQGIGVEVDNLRKGNVMARIRMICVFDLAKQLGAIVCGTENKSEHYLGYFTRFGDSASDVEPIAGLYKTQVWEMAKELGMPAIFYTKAPSAGLWEGQTDESEMGFSYKEADQILKGEILGLDSQIVEKVQKKIEQNRFKLEVPYVLS